MSSRKNRRRRGDKPAKFKHPDPTSIAGAFERYWILWSPAGENFTLQERLAVSWQLLFALRWFLLPGLLLFAFILIYVVLQ